MYIFPKEYFIFLTEDELNNLVTAYNRDDYRPALDLFLKATNRLSSLRALSLEKQDHIWEPPVLYEKDGSTIIDEKGSVRGCKHIFCLPTKPGEPQMALSYDWFWSEFCNHANQQGVYAFQLDTSIVIYQPSCAAHFKLENFWNQLWNYLSSEKHLRQSVLLYSNNKSLFKNPAAPWTPGTIPILSQDQAQFLVDYYQHGPTRKKLFKQRSIPRAIEELQQVINSKNFSTIPFLEQSKIKIKKGGDYHTKEEMVPCAGCGEIIKKKNGFKRSALFLKDADERPQSATCKDDLNIFCPYCIATVFFCPIKLTSETLAVRFHSKNKEKYSSSQQRLRQELKKYVAQSLHVVAGDFIGLHVEESFDKKPLLQTLGAYHYALWKMAVTFPPELFAQGFSVEVYPGEEIFQLPRWLLWIAAAFASWDDVFRYKCYTNKDYRTHFTAYIRLLPRKKIFQAFYVLISGKLIHESYAHTWKMYQLQDIWSNFETILQEENPMPIPDYPKIAGFAGLLLPLAQRVESAQKGQSEKERAIKKLLEEVDRPIQYAYTAARDSGSKEFIFCKRASNKFFFDKAVELLAWAGEDVEKLKSTADKIVNENEGFSWARDAESKIFISIDQITRVISALVSEGEKPYVNEADWRSFAYQVKLALWSFFPQYLGTQE